MKGASTAIATKMKVLISLSIFWRTFTTVAVAHYVIEVAQFAGARALALQMRGCISEGHPFIANLGGIDALIVNSFLCQAVRNQCLDLLCFSICASQLHCPPYGADATVNVTV